MPSRVKPAQEVRAGKVTKSPKVVAATKSKPRGKRRSGSRGPRVVGRNVPPAIIAMSRALRDARARSGLSKAAAADKVGVHFVTLYAWENENRTDQPSDENLARAAKAYGTTAEALQRRAKAIEQGLGSGPAAGSESSESAAPAAPAKAPAGARKRAKHAEPPAKAAVAKRPVGRPRSVVAPTRATASGAANHGSATLSHQAYARVLRVLADLAEDLSLSPSALGAAQQALTAPGMLDVFAAFTQAPMTDADVLNAIDATSVAVRSFVSARKAGGGQK
jgi:transcriptional regulator with XRE-family HTH domain